MHVDARRRQHTGGRSSSSASRSQQRVAVSSAAQQHSSESEPQAAQLRAAGSAPAHLCVLGLLFDSQVLILKFRPACKAATLSVHSCHHARSDCRHERHGPHCRQQGAQPSRLLRPRCMCHAAARYLCHCAASDSSWSIDGEDMGLASMWCASTCAPVGEMAVSTAAAAMATMPSCLRCGMACAHCLASLNLRAGGRTGLRLRQEAEK